MAAGIQNLRGSLYYYLDDMPWKEKFRSDSLNGTMIKPLVELITGRDMITGEVLSNYERRLRTQQFKENLGNIGLVIARGAALGLGGIEIAALAGLATIVSVGGKAANSVSQKAVKELGGSDRLAEIYGFRAEVIARVLGAKLICDNYIDPRIEVEMVGAVEEGISSQRIEYYLNQSRNNTGSDTAMLGSTGRYDVIAEGEGYAYFKMEDDLWSSLVNEAGQNYDEVWKVNQRFLDEQIELNKNILLTDDLSAGYYFPDGSRRFYQRELDYLTEKGYTFEKIKDGIWKAIRK